METDTKQKTNNGFGYSIICHHITKFICIYYCLFHAVELVFRSHKLKALIKLIRKAKVDEVESWLKTNIPSKHQVLFFKSCSFYFDVCVTLPITQSQTKRNTH